MWLLASHPTSKNPETINFEENAISTNESVDLGVVVTLWESLPMDSRDGTFLNSLVYCKINGFLALGQERNTGPTQIIFI